MDARTTHIPEDSTQSGLEFMMELLQVEIDIYVEERNFETAALMCRHFLAYHAKWEDVKNKG